MRPNNDNMNNPLPPLSEQAKNFKPGLYKHYKGDMYKAYFVARHSEARNEEFVVYESLKKGLIWVRPLNMFLENVDKPEYNYKGPRFKFISENE